MPELSRGIGCGHLFNHEAGQGRLRVIDEPDHTTSVADHNEAWAPSIANFSQPRWRRQVDHSKPMLQNRNDAVELKFLRKVLT